MVISFLRGSTEYRFNEENQFDGITVYLTGAVNWGLAPQHRIVQRGPFQDGDTDIDFRLDPRVVNLPIISPASSMDESMRVRQKLLQIFTAGNDNSQIYILFEGDTTTQQRILDVHVAGGLTMDNDGRDFTVRGVIQLRASNPTWYQTYDVPVTISAQLFGTPTPYPKPYPVPYGSDSINKFTNVTYEGTWLSYPVIQCIGPASNLTIVDSLGNTILFDDPISAGDIWTIDLRYGAKTVLDQNGINKFQALNINSNLVSFALYPRPTVFDGINTISVSATGTDSDSQVLMYYDERYVGI
jgi:hypothetical protein